MAAAGVTFGLGVVVAVGSTRVTDSPLIQSMGTALVAWILGSFVGAALWIRRPAPDAGVLAVKWSVPQVLVGAIGVLLAGAVLHALFSALNVLHPAFGSWGHLMIGVMASLAGCRGYASGMAFGKPLR
jgi:CDP-diglyceride synthetase